MLSFYGPFHELLRRVARAYYDKSDIVLLDVFIELDRSTNHNVKEGDVVSYSQLGSSQVHNFLHRMRSDKIIRTTIQEVEKNNSEKHSATKKRPRKNTAEYRWFLDPDHFCKGMQYRIEKILHDLDKLANDKKGPQYRCPVKTCLMKGRVYNIMELLQHATVGNDRAFRCPSCKTIEGGGTVQMPLVSEEEGGRVAEELKTLFNKQMAPINEGLRRLKLLLHEERQRQQDELERRSEQHMAGAESKEETKSLPQAPHVNDARVGVAEAHEEEKETEAYHAELERMKSRAVGADTAITAGVSAAEEVYFSVASEMKSWCELSESPWLLDSMTSEEFELYRRSVEQDS